MLKKLAIWAGKNPALLKGIGDDAAVIDRGGCLELISTDMFVDGDHFRLDWFSPAQVASKCVEAGVSDIYAMGGKPKYVFLSLSVPACLDEHFLERFFQEAIRVIGLHGAVLAGGDTTHGALAVIDVCVVGEVDRSFLALRSGASVGDLIAVTGELGGSWAGLELLRKYGRGAKESLDFRPSLVKYLEPKSRPDAARVLAGKVTAMIDVSDGIGSEVRHICEQSGKGAVIVKENIPLFPNAIEAADHLGQDPFFYALSGGEDFQLLFTIGPEKLKDISEVDYTVIGEVTEESGVLLKSGEVIEGLPHGYDHFDQVKK